MRVMLPLIVLLFSGLAHALVGIWLLDAFPRLRAHKRIVIAVLASFVGLGTISRLITSATHSEIAGSIYALASSELIIVVFSAVPIIVVRIIGRIAEATSPKTSTPAPDEITRRQVIERVGGVAALGATGSLVGWGAIIGRHDFKIDEVPVKI